MKHKGEYNKETNELTAYGITTKLVANEVFPVTLPMEIDDSEDERLFHARLAGNLLKTTGTLNVADGNQYETRIGLVKTTPKIQNAGQICPNLLEIEGRNSKESCTAFSHTEIV